MTKDAIRKTVAALLLGTALTVPFAHVAGAQSDPSDPSDCPTTDGPSDPGSDPSDPGSDPTPGAITAEAVGGAVVFNAPTQDECTTDGTTDDATDAADDSSTDDASLGATDSETGGLAETGGQSDLLLFAGLGAAGAAFAVRKLARR
jgi:hypothetical protein